MYLGNKKENGHVMFGNKRGPMMMMGMKGKALSMLKSRGRESDEREKEKKSPLER